MTVILTFSLADQDYALDVTAVREVIRMVRITPLPDAPAEVLGAIDVHSTPALVFDLRQRFDLPPQPPRSNLPLLLVEWQGALLAILVDEVYGVKHIEHEPDATGLIRVEDKLVSLLKVDQLPTDKMMPLLVKSTV
jgi:purine-binding chemotaxis protein CheW